MEAKLESAVEYKRCKITIRSKETPKVSLPSMKYKQSINKLKNKSNRSKTLRIQAKTHPIWMTQMKNLEILRIKLPRKLIPIILTELEKFLDNKLQEEVLMARWVQGVIIVNKWVKRIKIELKEIFYRLSNQQLKISKR